MSFSRQSLWRGEICELLSQNIEETFLFLVDHHVQVEALEGEGVPNFLPSMTLMGIL